ncbi:MAG: hypothetical protein DMG75_15300 [Acidobacteria bacterium]|nr:MAG: hypothetical protein DMG75_15300 [Acidobacteriota bacterium]
MDNHWRRARRSHCGRRHHCLAFARRAQDAEGTSSLRFQNQAYLDGTITNTGDRTVTHAVIHVIFKDSMGQVAQTEDVPLHVLQTSGPYPDAVDLSVSPLAPGQSKQFRLTFESVSAQWNHEFPELQITDLTTK